MGVEKKTARFSPHPIQARKARNAFAVYTAFALLAIMTKTPGHTQSEQTTPEVLECDALYSKFFFFFFTDKTRF